MKKAPLLITVGIVVLSAVGYFSYQKFFNQKLLSLWDVVPSNAVAVYEASPCRDCIDQSKRTVLGDLIQRSTFFQKGADSLNSILGLIGFPTEGTLVSMHVTKKDAFDFTFYVPIKNKRERLFLENVLGGWSEDKSYKYSERILNTVKIQQLSGGGQVMSWVFLNDNWVFSFTPYLIEDVIRAHQSGGRESFKESMAGVFSLPKIQKDVGNLYVNFARFSEWLNVFGDQIPASIQQVGNSLLLDIKTLDDGMVLNGFSSNKKGSIFSIFNQQTPTAFGIRNLISNRALLVTNFGISNGAVFYTDLNAFGSSDQKRKVYSDTLKRIEQTLSFEVEELYKSIDNEIAVCYFEAKGPEWSKVLLVETSDSKIWLDQLNRASEKLSIDTVFFEQYSAYEIRELPLPNFGEKLFYPILSGFDQTFYTSIENVVLISSDIEVLKRFLDDIDQEETWGRSVVQNQFLETTLLESTISVYINTPKIWNSISGRLHPKWQEFISGNPAIINAFKMGAIQFSHLNESFYTNITWQFGNPNSVPSKPPSLAKTTTNFNAPLNPVIFIGKNHVDKSNEVLVQDSLFSVHLISRDGKALWEKEVGSPILGEIYQIDYYKNGKLQYLFATSGELHLIDRLGNYVESFPKSIPAKEIAYITVVDYDRSKNYRFLVAEQNGKLWMFDTDGKNLPGWNPRNVGGALSIQPRHFRARGKDYLLAVRKDGETYLMNRRGELLNRFPLKTDSRPIGDFFIENGKTTNDTFIVLVADGGYRIRISLEGVIESRETLIRTDVNARFKLITDPDRQSYVYARKDHSHLSVFSQGSTVMLENNFLGEQDASIGYYDFGNGNIFVTITDLVQQISFVYSGTGKLLTQSPVQGSAIRLNLVEGKPKIYFIRENQLIIQDL